MAVCILPNRYFVMEAVTMRFLLLIKLVYFYFLRMKYESTSCRCNVYQNSISSSILLDSWRKLLCSITHERIYNGFGIELYALQVSHRFGKLGFNFPLNFRPRRIALLAILHENQQVNSPFLGRARATFRFFIHDLPSALARPTTTLCRN